MSRRAMQAGIFADERIKSYATRDELNDACVRVSVIEERLSHTATKSWVLGGAIVVMTGTLSALWWITQQYLAPLLHASGL